MSDERAMELGVACLDVPATELSEVVGLARHWWPDETSQRLADVAIAAVHWTLIHGFAELDAGNYSEPATVAPERWDSVLGDPANWEESRVRRMFLRVTAAGAVIYRDRDAWPIGFRDRMDRIVAKVEAVDLERLASELAARLAPVAPDGYVVEARGPTLAIREGPYGSWCDLRADLASHGISEWVLPDILRNLLTNLQQDFTEAQAMPWPTSTTSYLGQVFADPEVRMSDEAIEMWFGPEDHPALVLAPIPLSTITTPAI